MQRTVTLLLTGALVVGALAACSGGKSSSSSSTTTAQSSPGAAASPVAGASAGTSSSMAKAPGAGGGAGSAAAGQTVYSTNCASCHQANGKGQPGVFPPLAGNPAVTGDPKPVIHIVKNGLTGKVVVNGTTYNGQMPAWKGTLSNTDIANVITYIRSSWGNSASPVIVSQVSSTP